MSTRSNKSRSINPLHHYPTKSEFAKKTGTKRTREVSPVRSKYPHNKNSTQNNENNENNNRITRNTRNQSNIIKSINQPSNPTNNSESDLSDGIFSSEALEADVSSNDEIIQQKPMKKQKNNKKSKKINNNHNNNNKTNETNQTGLELTQLHAGSQGDDELSQQQHYSFPPNNHNLNNDNSQSLQPTIVTIPKTTKSQINKLAKNLSSIDNDNIQSDTEMSAVLQDISVSKPAVKPRRSAAKKSITDNNNNIEHNVQNTVIPISLPATRNQPVSTNPIHPQPSSKRSTRHSNSTKHPSPPSTITHNNNNNNNSYQTHETKHNSNQSVNSYQHHQTPAINRTASVTTSSTNNNLLSPTNQAVLFILADRIRNGNTQYRVQVSGQEPDEEIWMNESKLLNSLQLKDYLQRKHAIGKELTCDTQLPPPEIPKQFAAQILDENLQFVWIDTRLVEI